MTEPILLMRRISRAFPGVQALDGVDFELRPGEVHVLLGENGAGKSTLMKVLTGIHGRDAGEVLLDGRPIDPPSLLAAQRIGISMVLQEFNLIPHLSVAENLILINRPEGPLFEPVRWRALQEEAKKILDRLGIRLSPSAMIADLSVAEKQMVEIAKALSLEARIIIMDEPTAALSDAEVERLFNLIRELKNRGIAVVYISHRFEEIFAIGDRVTVLRDGKKVATHNLSEVSRDELIHEMVGRELKDFYPKKPAPRGSVALELRNLSSGDKLEGISFKLHYGEILGVAGLMGAGRTELAKAIFGVLTVDSGEILREGRPFRIKNPRQAMKAGIALLTEDRKDEGLILPMTLAQNVTITHLKQVLTAGLISPRKESSRAKEFVERLRIVPRDIRRPAETLSGGNQQKLVLAKWLGIEPKILILDEPTRGIDVGAKVEIHELMNRFVAMGGGVLLISSELPELIGMCDRIVVMHDGRLTGELAREDFSQEKILNLATGG